MSITISVEEMEDFEKALLRCEGYAELGMIDEAEQELLQIPTALRETLPFLATSMKVFMRLGWWSNAAQVGLHILEQWPGQQEVKELTLHCLLQSGSRNQMIATLMEAEAASARRRRRRS